MTTRLANFNVESPALNLRALEQENLKNKQWIQTFTGKKISPLDMDPSQVDIRDIAHALANKCRYTGHCEPFYSVAEHSVRVSNLLPPDLALAGLLHDAAEAYLPDVAAPIKSMVLFRSLYGASEVAYAFSVIEKDVLTAIGAGLGLEFAVSLADADLVKWADLTMLATEVRDVMAPPPENWGLILQPDLTKIIPYSNVRAEELFLAKFWELVLV